MNFEIQFKPNLLTLRSILWIYSFLLLHFDKDLYFLECTVTHGWLKTNPALVQTFGVFSVMREKKTMSYQTTFSSLKRLSRLCLDSISFTIDRVCQSWFNERLAFSFCKHQLHPARISPQWKDQMSHRCLHSWNLAHLHIDLAWTHHRQARNVFKAIRAYDFFGLVQWLSIFQP